MTPKRLIVLHGVFFFNFSSFSYQNILYCLPINGYFLFICRNNWNFRQEQPIRIDLYFSNTLYIERLTRNT